MAQLDRANRAEQRDNQVRDDHLLVADYDDPKRDDDTWTDTECASACDYL